MQLASLNNNTPGVVIALITALGVCIADIHTPSGIATPMLYIFCVLCALEISRTGAAYVIAFFTSILTVVGGQKIGDHGSIPFINILANRILAIVLLWMVALVVERCRVAQVRLYAEREQTEATLQNVFGAIITIDTKGIIRLFNPMAERIFGYLATEVLGKNVNILMPSGHGEKHDGYLAHYLTSGDARIIGKGRDVMARRKNGSEFPVALGVSEAVIGDERLFIGLLVDISERKAAEAEVERRTRQLEESNQALDDFAYIASHDLKEPLRGIHNYASFLLEDYGEKLEQDGKDKLDTLVQLSRRLEELINSLLYYSRLGREEMAFKYADFNEIVEELAFSLKPVCEEKQCTIRVPEALPVVHCDPVRCGELLRNLITNAMKYNKNEQKWVEVGHHTQLDGTYLFYVKDNGIGIPEKHREHVFKTFKRLHPRHAFGGGTGAGLTIAKKIVERHQGRIWVEANPDGGSIFYFTLQEGVSA